jgi:HAMP domain-containing protein
MSLWLFIGIVFAAVLLLALWRGRSRTTSTIDDQSAGTNEHRRGADVRAEDAARAADARIAPKPGGSGF